MTCWYRVVASLLIISGLTLTITDEADARRGWRHRHHARADLSFQSRLDTAVCDNILKDVERGLTACTRLAGSAVAKKRLDALASRAQGYMSIGNLETALSDLDEAIRILEVFRIPTNGTMHYSRAWIYANQDQPDRALADYAEAIRLSPTSAAFYLDRGVLHAQRGNSDLALQDFNTALELDSKLVQAYYRRAALFHSRGGLERAIRELTEAIQIDRKYVQAYGLRGDYLLELGEVDRAVRDFKEAININPRFAPAYIKLAELNIKQENYVEAARNFTEAIIIDPKVVANYVGRAFAHAKRDDWNEARRDYDEALFRDADNRAALEGRSILFFKVGDYVRGLEDAKKALALNSRFAGKSAGERAAPSDYYASLLIGNLLREHKQFEECVNVLYRGILAIEKSPPQSEYHEIYYGRARCHSALRRFDLAETDLKTALQIVPDQPHALAESGNIIVERGGSPTEALDLIRRAAKQLPEDAHILGSLGWVLYQLDEIDEAVTHLRRAAERAPNDGVIQHRLGDALWKANKRGEAFAAWQAARKRATDRAEITKLDEKIRSGLADGSASRTAPKPTGPLAPAPKAPPPPAPEEAAPAPSPTPDVPRPAERRVALVIGNSAYQNVAQLANPGRDATAIAATLREIGFDVVVAKTDLDRTAFVNAMRTFGNEAAKADWAMVYYAGHGMEINGRNYLVPTDAKYNSIQDVQYDAIPLELVLGTVEGASKLKLVILDACRDNPFITQLQSGGRGGAARTLGVINSEGGTMIAYAAKQGQVAQDGIGNNSPFVESLVRNMQRPGLELNMVFRRVRDEVLAATGKRQEPFSYGSLPGQQFFFVNPK
jgi:tetratricopeptide (TPR) repeat protein